MTPTLIEARSAPTRDVGLWGWLRANLFNSIPNTIITVVLVVGIIWALLGTIAWLMNAKGWPAVLINLRLFMMYLYPPAESWRLVVCLWVVAALLGLSAGKWRGMARGIAVGLVALLLASLIPLLMAPPSGTTYPIGPEVTLLVGVVLIVLGYPVGQRLPGWGGRLLSVAWFLAFPLLLALVHGLPGMTVVPTNVWGGFMLTLILTIVGIIGSFPIGILLALGRRSTLPIVRWFCTLYIELIRGVPLVTFFFLMQFLLPLFMPRGLEIDNLLRAMVAVSLFSAAYLAENVRGGLQSLPKGQDEAARALGLSYWQATLLITLPQALRAVIPALVGQFISLFKDTSLVAIIGVFDLLGVSTLVRNQPQWLGTPGGVWRETFFFVALIYFIFSFTMSRVSLRVEHNLGVGQR